MWIKGKPDKPGLVVVQWLHGGDAFELQLVIRLADGKLYFFPGQTDPYPLEKSSILQHIYLPQPVNLNEDGDEHFTTDFNPETCEWADPDFKKPVWYDPTTRDLAKEKEEMDEFVVTLSEKDYDRVLKREKLQFIDTGLPKD